MQGMFRIIVMAGLMSLAMAAHADHDTNITLSKTTPNGVSITGNFTYLFTAHNVGPTDETGVTVEDPLPPGITYVSDTCGGGVTGGIWYWSLGNLNHTNSASCTLTVSAGSPAYCPVVTNGATLLADSGFTVSASTTNGSTSTAVADPGFELGTGWSDNSDNFGTPRCDSTCFNGVNGAHAGSYWMYFGGEASGPESAYANQSIVIPTAASALRFYVRMEVCNTHQGAGDYVRLLIDGHELWREDATSANCGEMGYRKVEVPLGTYANGAGHTLEFDATQTGDGDVSNFFIDDVNVVNAVCGAGSDDTLFKNGFEL
jgi:uncharacterized repeat protein (TIGR01451 family)